MTKAETRVPVRVVAAASGLEAEAERLAERLGLEWAAGGGEDGGDTDGGAAEGGGLRLVLSAEGLELREVGSRAGPVRADLAAWRRLAARPRTGELLARAVGIKGRLRAGVRVADATAGLGGDGWQLAALGCEVTLLERSSVVAALLGDGLERAAADPALRAVASRLRLVPGDARTLLPALAPPPEVVLLDPMYPPSGKRALKRKEMRLLRELLGDDPDASELLEVALGVAERRVVVKRPLKAPPLGVRAPSASVTGTTTRYDLYF